MSAAKIPAGPFKLSPDRREAKADATTRASRHITQTEASLRDAKTAKLRELRLGNEAVAVPVPAVKPGGRKRKAG